MRFWRMISTALLLIVALCVNAKEQNDAKNQGEDPKVVEMRQKIGIDYSMQDFSTSRIDGSVIGERLAKMLRLLGENPLDHLYNRRMSAILYEQDERMKFVKLDDFKIKLMEKQGDIITVKIRAKLKSKTSGVMKTDIILVFDKGVSESQVTNELFSDLSRYIKEE